MATLRLDQVEVYERQPGKPQPVKVADHPAMGLSAGNQTIWLQHGEFFYVSHPDQPIPFEELPDWAKAEFHKASPVALRQCGWVSEEDQRQDAQRQEVERILEDLKARNVPASKLRDALNQVITKDTSEHVSVVVSDDEEMPWLSESWICKTCGESMEKRQAGQHTRTKHPKARGRLRRT